MIAFPNLDSCSNSRVRGGRRETRGCGVVEGSCLSPEQLQEGKFAIPSPCPCSFQAMFDWLDNAVIKLCNMSPVGTDLSTVKEQMNEMKVPGRGGTASAALLRLTELQ